LAPRRASSCGSKFRERALQATVCRVAGFVTGFAETAIAARQHLARGMTVMTKPFEISHLVRRVRDLVDGAPSPL
jgi:hypothetical protein